jgi:hypothetical protein
MDIGQSMSMANCPRNRQDPKLIKIVSRITQKIRFIRKIGLKF